MWKFKAQGYHSIFPIIAWDRDNLMFIIWSNWTDWTGEKTYQDEPLQPTWWIQRPGRAQLTRRKQMLVGQLTQLYITNNRDVVRIIFITQWFFGREKKTIFIIIIILELTTNLIWNSPSWWSRQRNTHLATFEMNNITSIYKDYLESRHQENISQRYLHLFYLLFN